jgi:hypothetical protein
MYVINKKDNIEQLPDVPMMDVGAPQPIVISNDTDLVLGYNISSRSPNSYPNHVEVVDGGLGNGRFALIRFWRVVSSVAGDPNEDNIHNHPLHEKGLKAYMAVKVVNSSWLTLAKETYKISDEKLNHFIFTFHDSSFECFARSYWVTVLRGCDEDVIKQHLLKPFFGPFA